MAKDENNGSFRRVVYGVLVMLLTGWISWISICAIAADRRVSVVESSLTYIQSDMRDVKVIVKDIRDDQIRRAERERK